MLKGFGYQIQKERNDLKELKVGGTVILKRILEKCDKVLRTRFVWLRNVIGGNFS
jgi:hypothetical protein